MSDEAIRHSVREVGWVRKRAKLVAKDEDPYRVERLARIRWVYEQLRLCKVMVFADELDSHLRPKISYAWMPQSIQVEVMTPGTSEKRSLAGALDVAGDTPRHCSGQRKTHGLFREPLQLLEAAYPAPSSKRVFVVVDNDKIHKAKAVEQWLAEHPRLTLLCLPTHCPRANPIERTFGDVHELCTRHHTRKRLRDLVADVEEHPHINGP